MSRIRNTSGNTRHGPPVHDPVPLGHTGQHHPDVESPPDGIDDPARRRLGQDPFSTVPPPAPASTSTPAKDGSKSPERGV